MKYTLVLATAFLVGCLPSLSFEESVRASDNPASKEMRKRLENLHEKYRQLEKRKPLSEEELEKLDVSLKSMWNSMRDALSQGDIDRALSYFSESTRESYRRNFKSWSPQALKRLAEDLADIQFIKQKGNIGMEYDISLVKGGKRFSFHLLFVLDPDEKWRIRGF